MQVLDDQYVAGKYIVELHEAYSWGQETIKSLDWKFDRLRYALGYPDWLVMLSRNCEYATDIPAFEGPFKMEFAYIAKLWAEVSSRTEFEAKYSRAVSNQHDLIGPTGE